jgi:hypothetical protein
MSENQGQEGGGADSAGALIRRAREHAGLHVGALAASLKVPVQRIEALEADRHDLLPGPVFTRALASSVCRLLKLDSAAVLALLPKAAKHDLVVPGDLNQAFRSVGHGSAGRARARLSRPAAIAGAALLLAAVLVYAAHSTWRGDRDRCAGSSQWDFDHGRGPRRCCSARRGPLAGCAAGALCRCARQYSACDCRGRCAAGWRCRAAVFFGTKAHLG